MQTKRSEGGKNAQQKIVRRQGALSDVSKGEQDTQTEKTCGGGEMGSAYAILPWFSETVTREEIRKRVSGLGKALAVLSDRGGKNNSAQRAVLRELSGIGGQKKTPSKPFRTSGCRARNCCEKPGTANQGYA